MRYEKYSYLYPPRPETPILPPMLGYYEANDYQAQVKKNGTGSVLAITPARQIIAMTRHKEPHKLWQADGVTAEPFRRLKGGWYVFVSELLHNKCAIGPKHTNYLNDMLVSDGEMLVGTTFAERQTMMASLFPDAVPHVSGGYAVIDANTWLATNHHGGFKKLLARTRKRPEDEGLVLKKSTARLAFCTKPASNSSWMVKCYS